VEAADTDAAEGAAEQEELTDVPLDLTDLALDELPVDLCLALARARFRRGEIEEAQRALESACIVAYDNVSLADQCAEACLELGQLERARAILEARLAKSDAVMGYRLYAQLLLILGQQDTATTLCQQLRETHSGQITAWNIIGDVALACTDLETAQDAYAEILRRSPTSTSGLLGMARYHAAIGDEEAARRELAGIFAAYGDHPSRWALHNAREIAERLGDEDWLAELDARLADLARREDQRLAERLRLARQGQLQRAAPPPPKAALKKRESTLVIRPEESDDIPEPPEPAELATEAPPELLEALRDHFGYESFRPGQIDVIQAALAGEDSLALMPTGAGKSLCYQLPAMLLPGATVLISPLIALMRDQVQNLPETMRAHTAFINSELDTSEQERRLRELAEGRLKLVYVAPERLRQPAFIHALRRARVSLFVIDEAHCISQWGHDFRPDYLFIPKALRAMAEQAQDGAGALPILALTATATPDMRQEIGGALGRRLRVITTGVFRPNLRYEVEHLESQEDKLRALAALCAETGGPGIVYARSRESCEKLAYFLRQQGIKAAHYHAGMNTDERTQAQNAFMSGQTRVIVATVAFGMGIDKADVRFIIHYNLPNSLEAYCQESGRAGRDGRPARCVLFYSGGDKSQLSRWLRQDTLDLPFLRAVYGEIRRQMGAGGKLGLVASAELERAINTLMQTSEREASDTMVRVSISLLERGGLLTRHFDAPRAASVTWHGVNDQQPPELAAFIKAADLISQKPPSVDLLALAAQLDLRPGELEERLLAWRDVGLLDYRANQRQMLIELLPAPPDATQRLQDLLDTLQEQREAQIARLASYARSTMCRHKTIARHFAEAMTRSCGVCDRCAPAHPSNRPGKTSRAARRQRSGSDADLGAGEQTILLCLLSLPVGVGKTGLARILTGSIAAPLSGKRSAYYGRLATLSTSRIEKMAQGMLDAGYLQRDERSEYNVLTVTAQGRALLDDA
jgi:ATP-dependent DNA helicase RecQ